MPTTASPKPKQRIGPQPGPQEQFLSKRWVDLIVYGGAAGGGKSYALLLDALYNAALQPVNGYGAVIFRRTSPQITATGGLWETSQRIYPFAGGKPRQTPWLGWEWGKHGTTVRFSHLQHEDDKLKWQGAQIPFIGFDELTHFTESQFFYLLSRNRSPVAGVQPVMRATTNPEPDSWVKAFLAPWVDSDYSDPAKSGEVRYFYRDGDNTVWLRSPADRPDYVPRENVHSVCFIEARLEDNPALMESDPGYRGRLQAMPLYERTILTGGPQAWNIRRDGNTFKREYFDIVDAAPADLPYRVRRWDFAGTEPRKGYNDPDWTVGALWGRTSDGVYYVLDVVRVQAGPDEVKRLVRQTAELDGKRVPVRFEQEPGSAGKYVVADLMHLLDGWDVQGEPSTGDKVTRARPVAAQAQARNIKLVKGQWNSAWINEHCAFPTAGVHDDQVDTSSGAHNWLAEYAGQQWGILDW